jgi:hypothetical protein
MKRYDGTWKYYTTFVHLYSTACVGSKFQCVTADGNVQIKHFFGNPPRSIHHMKQPVSGEKSSNNCHCSDVQTMDTDQ